MCVFEIYDFISIDTLAWLDGWNAQCTMHNANTYYMHVLHA